MGNLYFLFQLAEIFWQFFFLIYTECSLCCYVFIITLKLSYLIISLVHFLDSCFSYCTYGALWLECVWWKRRTERSDFMGKKWNLALFYIHHDFHSPIKLIKTHTHSSRFLVCFLEMPFEVSLLFLQFTTTFFRLSWQSTTLTLLTNTLTLSLYIYLYILIFIYYFPYSFGENYFLFLMLCCCYIEGLWI